MREMTEIRALLPRLDEVEADALEGQDLDFKEWPADDRQAIRQAVDMAVCMANGGGGTVVLGVRDRVVGRAKAILGVPLSTDLHQLKRDIYERTAPKLTPEIVELNVPEGTGRLLLMQVHGGLPPYTNTAGGGTVRRGKDCVPLTGDLRDRLMVERGDSDITSVTVPGPVEPLLSPSALERLRDLARQEQAPADLLRKSDLDLLAALEVLRDGKLTKAGLLIAGNADAIVRHLPNYSWTHERMKSATVYVDRTDGRDTRELALPLALQALESRINADNPITTVEHGLYHLEFRAYPTVALREALLNALCHLDLRLASPVLVKQYARKLEISNPGGLIGGITPANILHHPPLARNPLLVQALSKLRLVNRSNLGIGRMFESMLVEGKEPPVIVDEDSAVRVVFKRQETSASFRAFIADEGKAGDANCPFDDCARLIPGEHVKNEAQEGRMGEQLYGVVVKRRVVVGQKASGKVKEKWIRAFRAPRDEDDVLSTVRKQLDERMPIWEAMNIVPTEAIGELSNYDRGHRMYGMTHWRDMFSPRQLLGHGYGVEAFRALIQEEESEGRLTDALKGALIYLSFAIDKLLNYNARSTRWDGTTGRIRSVFDSHNFAIVWSYAEMAPTVVGQGFSWAIEETGKALAELVTLCRPDADVGSSSQSHFDFEKPRPKFVPPEVILTCTSGDSLGHLTDGQIDAVVLDPPYYDNVMYAELSDFFYVWLKRTAGYIYPELFLRGLTDKENEAIANPAKFKDQKGGKLLAGRDYQNRMAGIFTEARRVLKPDGIMTLMFTHKATGAWDALTKGLIEAGFTITASWPINTEAEGSLHIKDKSAANSTVFLVCRPRVRAGDDVRYWEEVEPTVRKAVRQRIAQFQEGGIRGVDLYLSCFGPALEAFSQNWPLVRGTPRQDIEQTRRKKRQAEIFEEEYDPYAVTPEDALEVARREVKDWRLHQLAHVQRNVELDNLTSWFVLAWDAFEAPIFPYDEANRLAKVCGVDLDREVVGRLAEKKGSDLVMWDSVTRVAKGSLGLPDGRDSMMDALHHLARTTRSASLESANELLAKHSLANEPIFLLALEAVLEVLPVGKEWSGLDLPDAAEGAGADFDALEKLRRLALSEKVAEPEQLKIWQEESAA